MNRMNNHKLYKAIALVLLFSIALSVASCRAKEQGGKAQKISSDSPWYDAEVIPFKLETKKNKVVNGMNYYLLGADDKYIAVYSNGAYDVAQWTDDVEYEDWLISFVTLIDRTTKKTVKSIDLLDYLGRYEYPMNASYCNGKILAYVESTDIETNTAINKEYEIDADTGKLLNVRKLSPDGEPLTSNVRVYSFVVGEYRIIPEKKKSADDNFCILNIVMPDGSLKEVELKDPSGDIYGVPFVLAIDDTTALIPASKEMNNKYYKLDLKTITLSPADEEYSWLDDEFFYYLYNSPKGNSYIAKNSGIYRVDLEKKTYEQTFDFNWCQINEAYKRYLQIGDYTDEKILLGGQYASTDSFKSIFDWDFVIIELTKAPKNPYAGRTILELYMPGGDSNAIVSDAIIRFNETNKKCFIRITDRYYGRYYQSVDYMASEDEDVITQSKKDADFSYDLANDILNGEGPDILMNTCALGQLNNPDYLIDLSPYVQDLDPDKYFTNIVEGAKTDGKLYQLPVCYTLKGIQTSKELAGRSGTGFTTGEYKDFLYGTLNGGDVIEVTQIPYFAKLFNNMRDAFIKDGKADLTGPEFAELAQYVKDNVKQVRLPKSEENEEDPMAIDDPVFLKSNKALYCNCPGITGYLVKRARLKEATTILGIPSADGRGPLFGTNVSVAVSANAVNKDACIEFIKMLLTDEIQTEFVMNDRFVLNKEALRQGFAKAVGFYNTKEGQRNIFDYTAGTNVTINIKFTDEDLNNLENVILSCSGADSVDAAINMILIEEMPAYFAGQKTLEQVIPIMQNRIQKVLDERK